MVTKPVITILLLILSLLRGVVYILSTVTTLIAKEKNMKKLLVTTVFIASFSASATIVSDQEVEVYTQRSYEGRCQITRPLYRYEPCNIATAFGADIADCAFDHAMALCERDDNFDCVPVERSAIVWPTQSNDFPGYAKCQGKAVVRGYRN